MRSRSLVPGPGLPERKKLLLRPLCQESLRDDVVCAVCTVTPNQACKLDQQLSHTKELATAPFTNCLLGKCQDKQLWCQGLPWAAVFLDPAGGHWRKRYLDGDCRSVACLACMKPRVPAAAQNRTRCGLHHATALPAVGKSWQKDRKFKASSASL